MPDLSPTPNPWKTLSSRAIYSNPWISVREDQVIRPDGQPGIYGVVETRIAAGVLALTPEDELYLVGQYRYTMDAYSWEIIEGGTDPGEGPLEAAKRELQEEAGLAAEHWEALGGEIHVSNCHSSERGYVFIARGLSQVASCPDATEELQLRKVPFEEALRMVQQGEITDAIAMIGILLYAQQRRQP